jgi:hypothetical protein
MSNQKTIIMKIIIKAFFSFCLLAAFVVACKKDNSASTTTNKSTLTLSKSSVKMGEPLVVATNETGSNLFTKWSVTPAVNTWISSSNNKTVILFSSPGAYIVTASYFTDSVSPIPYDSSSSPVTVTDSVYNDSVVSCNLLTQVPINNGDQITLTPISYSDTGLVLLAHTQQTYGTYYPSLGNVQLTDSADGVYVFGFGTVTQYPCSNSSTNGPTPATGILSFAGLSNGTHNITIALNSVTYQGTLLVTDTDCTFTWNYSSGIIISPLQIQKR